MTLSKERTLKICEKIRERGLDIQFTTINGVSLKTLDREVMDALTGAGLIRLYVAPEHGSSYIRNEVMGKNLSDNKIYEFFDMIKDYKDLFVRAFFVVGYPQETKETLQETYDMVRKIRDSLDSVAMFNLVPYPGTEIFNYCEKHNRLLIPIEDLHNLETFSNYNYSDNNFVKPFGLEIDEIKEFRDKCHALVHRRPKSYDKLSSQKT